MSKKNNLTDAGLKRLCSFLVLAASQGQLINDTLQAQDKVFSSKHVTDLINSMSEQDKKYVDDIVANLNKLSSKTTSVIPDSSNAEPNTLYLYSADPNPTSYNQYMVLSDKTILDLGTTNISLEGYLKEVDADGKYLKQVDSHSHDNKLILDTISQDKIDEWDKGGDGLIPVTKAQHNELVTNGSTTINGEVVTYDADAFYVITDDENSTVDMSNYLTRADKVNMGEIDKNVSLNNLPASINKASVYYAPSYILDMPAVNDGMVIHMNIISEQHAIQQYNSLTTNDVYVRVKIGGTWGAWERLCKTKVKDVAETIIPSEESSITGTVVYKVEKGICYVSLWGVNGTTTGLDYVFCTSMPKCGITSGTTCTAAGGNGSNVAFSFILTNDTHLKINIFKTNVTFYGSFSYPVAEN